ncbi:MAG: T9SS type A sorting domain-containing protein [Bacteroidota bacterium]
MKNHIIIPLFFLLLLTSQAFPQPLRMLPGITPAGKGKVNTKVDNIGYWSRMVQLGYVNPAPVVTVPDAKHTGSVIRPWRNPVKPGQGMTSPATTIQDWHNHSPFTPQNSPDIPVTAEAGITQTENSVFIDPSDEAVVLNSNNSTSWKLGAAQDVYGADALYSYDEGQDWSGSTLGTNGPNNGDPSTAIGRNGWYYVGRITANNGQAVSYSQDQGKTWTRVNIANGPTWGNGLLDKNHLWIDNTLTSPFNGNLYDAWTNFIPGSPDTNQVQIVRSADNGLSWSSPMNISAAASALQLNHGVNINSGPNGEVYVAWSIYDAWPADENAIGFTKSLNGGSVFFPATRIISNIKGIRATMTGKAMRVNSFPSMAVDNSTGPNRGTIYIVWSNVGIPGVNTGTDIDVYLIRSHDGGATWSSPVRVNQDPAGLGKQHFTPWITCDQVTGGLCVIYYDDRNLASTDAAVFVSWSYDGGLSWTDLQVSDYSFTPEPVAGLAYSYFGDYIGIQSLNMKVYPVWTDNHNNGLPMSYTSPFNLGPNPNQPWVTYYSNSLSPVSGGPPVTMNNGDSLYLSLGLKNVGDQKALSVNATLSAGSPWVTITDSMAAYGTIDSAAVKVIPNGFTIKVSDTIPDNQLIRFNLRVTSTDSVWYSEFAIESHAPAMKLLGLTIIDTLSGNHNGRLDPGETVQIVVSNTNTGDFTCKGVYAKLTTTSPFLTFDSDSLYLDSIAPGQVRKAVFTATVNQDTPAGSGADLFYDLHSGLYHLDHSFREMIGVMIEDWESDTFTKYPWKLSGTLPWTITTDIPWEGIYTARSGAIPDYTTSRLILTYTSAVDDSISFHLRTSTEDGCDFLLFYLDGVIQGQWSGETPWSRVAFPVAAGQHEFKWYYQKDLSFYQGEDRVMVDFIVFPPPILPLVTATAGDTICAGMKASLQATVQRTDSLKWITTGDGAFENDTLAVTTYTPGTADQLAGHVTCRITGYGTYGNTSRNTVIRINPLPATAISVSPHDTVCGGQSIVLSTDTAGIKTWLWMPGNLATHESAYDSALAGGLGTHLVRLTVTNRFQCVNHDSAYITFKDCTGIPEDEIYTTRIYPNPGNGIFELELKGVGPGPLHLAVKNSLSETVYDEEDPLISQHERKKINLNFLPDGVYLLNLTTARGTSLHKLIIRK